MGAGSGIRIKEPPVPHSWKKQNHRTTEQFCVFEKNQNERWLFDFLLQKLKTMIICNNRVFDLLIIEIINSNTQTHTQGGLMQFLIPTSHWFTLTFLSEPAFTFPSKVKTLRPMGYRVIWVKCNLYRVTYGSNASH